MIPSDKGSEEEILRLLKNAVNDSGNLNQHFVEEKNKSFRREVFKGLSASWEGRPWVMSLRLFSYSVKLRFAQKKLLKFREQQSTKITAQKERVESLRFASMYGQCLNLEQRTWCFEICERFQIPSYDAAYLIWGMMICPRQKKIYYGYWDLLFGTVMTLPSIVPISFALCICTGANTLEVKAIALCLELIQIVFCFKLSKSFSFNLYRVGSKYFTRNGWKYSLPI